jgi:hypothetical protein
MTRYVTPFLRTLARVTGFLVLGFAALLIGRIVGPHVENIPHVLVFASELFYLCAVGWALPITCTVLTITFVALAIERSVPVLSDVFAKWWPAFAMLIVIIGYSAGAWDFASHGPYRVDL